MADATLNSTWQLLDWTAIPDTVTDTPGVDSGTLDLGDGITDATLWITVVHTDVNAAATNYVTINVYCRAGAADEHWFKLTSFQAGGGTAVLEAVAAESASGQNRIEVADTTDWDTGLQERLFLMDATLVNSELVTIIGWVDNDAYLCADNLTNTHADTADLLNGVNEFVCAIPNGVRYVKVVATNADDDANYAYRVDVTSITDYE